MITVDDQQDQKEYLSTKEAAAYLGICRASFYKLYYEKLLNMSNTRYHGKNLRYSRFDLDQLANQKIDQQQIAKKRERMRKTRAMRKD